ncbi:amidase [Flavilitoribacter nigricans]|uniref:Amidase n=1 Tax=Flavilitoribacter nigricans (strain ATCC 23147 / DSM 23189 / NBRC 102662 / NCIMB 1420 / SS-2) TaxID=1122177 RepID=A0A2D0NIA7_FLAN2|nr:amidase [Flavilitoribacter nigricans]PHN08232.1 amidase [Flavilitoribacter nigricans DSM 23189 = NBRC 102662]
MKLSQTFLVASLLLLLACRQAPVTEPNTTPEFAIELEETTIQQLQDGYQQGTFTIHEVVQTYLDRIAALDDAGPELNAIIQVNPDALAIADSLDRELQAGNSRGPMHGIPVVLKDNIDTHDQMFTTGGARALAGSRPLQDSYIVERLREAGAVILAKANLSEWANFHSSFSSSGWSSQGGQTKNPFDLTRNPCGSSAGSGVAVSANLTVIAIGTETNGSIVCPSNNNGIVGIKPTVGLLSRSGIIPISFTQDTPGPMARTVSDAAICLGAMVGVDSTDSKTLASAENKHTDYTQFLDANAIRGKRIGFYTAPLGQHFRVDTIVKEAIAYLESQGATVVEIDRIESGNVGRASFQVLLYEFKDGMDKYFASLGPDAPVKNMQELMEATLADSITMQYFDHDLIVQASKLGDLETAEYQESLESMLAAYRENGIDRVMDENNLDAIVAPTGGPAWKTDLTLGDKFGVFSSSPAARAGYPSVTLPMGSMDGLPLNISFFGRAWSEPTLLALAYAYEQGTKHRMVPTFRNGN